MGFNHNREEIIAKVQSMRLLMLRDGVEPTLVLFGKAQNMHFKDSILNDKIEGRVTTLAGIPVVVTNQDDLLGVY